MARQQGAVLAAMMMASAVFSAAAYSILFLAVSQARQAESLEDRVQARYAAEAGIVWAMAQLQANPDLRFSAGTTDLDGVTGIDLGGYRVDVFDDCPALPNPCVNRTLKATATNL